MSQTEEVLELLGKETWEKIESGVRRMIQNNEQNIERLKQYGRYIDTFGTLDV